MSKTSARRPVVLMNGRVRERASADPVEAIAVRGGRVVAIGGAREVLGRAGRDARAIDLGARTVLPAFVDSHTHFHRSSVLRRLYIDFQSDKYESIPDILRAVRERVAVLRSGAWAQGDGLTVRGLSEGRLPNRRELDAVAPANPVLLRGIGKHVVAANSLALEAAGITRDTPDPPGGRIERDELGEPTGVLHERAKLRLDASHPETVVPLPSRDDRLEAIRQGVRDLHRLGISTVHEMVREPEEAGDLSELHANEDLDLRVRLFYRVHETPLSLDWLIQLGIRRGLGDDWFRVAGIKISVDGLCIFENAAVYEPYRTNQANCGLLRIESDELCHLVRRAHGAGLGIAVHAVGARAVDMALDAFEQAGPRGALPHRIEHAYLDVDDRHLMRMRSLGLVWSTQPGFLTLYASEWDEILGRERAERIMPIARGARIGLPIVLNSDVPCGPIDPFQTLRAAVTRETPRGDLNRSEAIPLRQAWAAMTETPATVVGDLRQGHLGVGANADLVVLDHDPFSDARYPAMRVEATMIDGRFVFDEGGIGS